MSLSLVVSLSVYFYFYISSFCLFVFSNQPVAASSPCKISCINIRVGGWEGVRGWMCVCVYTYIHTRIHTHTNTDISTMKYIAFINSIKSKLFFQTWYFGLSYTDVNNHPGPNALKLFTAIILKPS